METSTTIPAQPTPSGGGRDSARGTIYPHRSVRFSEIGTGRLVVAFLVAAAMCGFMAYYSIALMEVHTHLVAKLYAALDLPVTSFKAISVFSGLQPGLTLMTPVPMFLDVGAGARIVWLGTVVVLMLCALRFRLLRSFLFFLIFLMVLSAVVNSVFERYEFDAGTFGQIWYRQVMLVWLILPWMTSIIFILFQPRLLEGLGWVLFSQIYSFAFSIVRMVFALGVLHFSGLLFFPMIWFLVGTLGELMYLLQFYSISIYRATGKRYKPRSQWASLY